MLGTSISRSSTSLQPTIKCCKPQSASNNSNSRLSFLRSINTCPRTLFSVPSYPPRKDCLPLEVSHFIQRRMFSIMSTSITSISKNSHGCQSPPYPRPECNQESLSLSQERTFFSWEESSTQHLTISLLWNSTYSPMRLKVWSITDCKIL